LLVLEQLQLLDPELVAKLQQRGEKKKRKTNGEEEEEEEEGMKLVSWLRSFFKKQWEVGLVARGRIRGRLRDAYRIDPSKSQDILKRRNPDVDLTVPRSERVEERFRVLDVVGQARGGREEEVMRVWRAFVLAFTPRHLPAFPHVACCLDPLGFCPVDGGTFEACDFPRLCKKHCPSGLLLSFDGVGHLYSQYEQYWLLLANQQCTQFANVVALMDGWSGADLVGRLWIAAASDRKDLLVREAPSWGVVTNWPQRFVDRIVK
jgi:hypothetical protein